MLKNLARLSRVVWAFGVVIAATTSGAKAVRADLFSSTVYAVQPLENARERTTSIAFSPNAAFVAWAVSGVDAGQMLWGYDSNGLKWTQAFDTNPDGAYVAFSSDSARLAVSSPLLKPKKGSPLGATLELFSTALSDKVPQHIVQVPKSLWKTVLPKYSVYQTVFSPDNKLLAGVCNDRTVRVWTVDKGQLFKTLVIGRDVKALVFTPNGELIVAAGTRTKGELQRWNLNTLKMTRKTDVGASFETLLLDDDGATVISGDAKGVLTFWNAATGAKTKTLAMEGSATKIQSLSPDGSLFAGFVAGENANDLLLALWNAETGALYTSYPGNRGAARPIAFSSNTAHIATGGVGGSSGVVGATLHVWPIN